ncbi:MAG: diadenylate cyclase CdaA [Deltaproteobacteria bacterium]|nr:diadenylate cyclase CdaA [Deltaproteobacteria bacterium]
MSLEALREYLTWRDVIDILVVAVIIYNLLLLVRRTRAMQMLLGIAFLALLYGISRLGDLPALQSLLGDLPILLPVAVIVLFQSEIRRVLASFGRNPFWGMSKQQKVAPTFDDVALTASTLASRKIGALLVIEREEGLRDFVENGISLDAVLSFDLLISIFHPSSPLHDGAVILQDDRVAAAACFLPLTNSSELSLEYGTRHRAALGIAEETDAVAVVVSEETGKISIAVEGRMITDLDAKDLRNELYLHLVTNLYPQGRRT